MRPQRVSPVTPRRSRRRRPDGRATSGSKGPIIQSLQRGLGILEIVAQKGTGITMAEVSRAIGLHASTTFHLLRTLVALEYLTQDEGTRQYRLGARPFQLAASAWTETQLSQAAAPFLAELARQTGETSHLAVFEGGEVVVVNKIDGNSPVRLIERVGYPRPAYCTAIGKALLAHLPQRDLKAYLGEVRLRAMTPRTITSGSQLEQELVQVRERGHAMDDEEFAQGIRCLAAPVRNFTGQVVAAIGISGPVWRVSPDRLAQLTQLVTETARWLSNQLGHAASTTDGN